MEAVNFDQANCVYTAEGCLDLPALKTGQGEHVTVTSVWKPSDEELAVLNSGGCVCLSVVGGQPPVSIWAQPVSGTYK